MSNRQIDLHCHSSASDGSDSPTELVRRAAKVGLRALALTDHDTVSGLENTTRTAIQAMWAGESVDTTIATIMEAKLLGE